MSNLPLISHHLFVAAVTNNGSEGVRQNPDQAPATGGFRSPSEIPLELLDQSTPMPATATRPLRGVVSARS